MQTVCFTFGTLNIPISMLHSLLKYQALNAIHDSQYLSTHYRELLFEISSLGLNMRLRNIVFVDFIPLTTAVRYEYIHSIYKFSLNLKVLRESLDKYDTNHYFTKQFISRKFLYDNCCTCHQHVPCTETSKFQKLNTLLS